MAIRFVNGQSFLQLLTAPNYSSATKYSFLFQTSAKALNESWINVLVCASIILEKETIKKNVL